MAFSARANDSIKLYGLEVKNLRLIRRRREREARGVTTAKCNFWGVPTLPYVFLDIVHPTKRLYFAIIVYCGSAALLSSVAQFGIFWQHCHSFLCEYSPKENMGEREGGFFCIIRSFSVLFWILNFLQFCHSSCVKLCHKKGRKFFESREGKLWVSMATLAPLMMILIIQPWIVMPWSPYFTRAVTTMPIPRWQGLWSSTA